MADMHTPQETVARILCRLMDDEWRLGKRLYMETATEIFTAIDFDAEEVKALREFAAWVETWVSNPVGAYSVDALNGLFGMTRGRLAALAGSAS